MVVALNPDVDSRKTRAGNCDDIQEAEIAEGGNQRHEQRKCAPHQSPPTAQCTHSRVSYTTLLEGT